MEQLVIQKNILEKIRQLRDIKDQNNVKKRRAVNGAWIAD